MEIIHKNIHFLREKRGWTQTQLAEKIGVSKSMIGAYEEFRSVPLLVVTKKLALVFDVSLDEFVRDDLSKKNTYDKISDTIAPLLLRIRFEVNNGNVYFNKMFLNLGHIGKEGKQGKITFPFSRNPHYRDPEIIPTEKQKGELAVGLYFVQTVLPYKNITGVRISGDDSDKGPDLIFFQDQLEIPVQITRLTFNNFPERKKLVRAKSKQFAELIYQKIPMKFRVLITLMPQELYKIPLSNLKRKGREIVESHLLSRTITFLEKSIPELMQDDKKYLQDWIDDKELKKYFSSIDIQRIPEGFFPHVAGFENIFIDYHFHNSGYSQLDLQNTVNKIFETKNHGSSEVLIIWANDYEIFDHAVLVNSLSVRFAESSFNEVYFMTFHEHIQFWIIKRRPSRPR